MTDKPTPKGDDWAWITPTVTRITHSHWRCPLCALAQAPDKNSRTAFAEAVTKAGTPYTICQACAALLRVGGVKEEWSEPRVEGNSSQEGRHGQWHLDHLPKL